MNDIPLDLLLSREEIEGLVTRPILSYRTERYLGGRSSLRLERDFGEVEVALIREFYRELCQLLELARPDPESLAEPLREAALDAFAAESRLLRYAEELEQVAVSAERTSDRLLLQSLREMTGGPFHGILAILLLARSAEALAEDFSSLYYLVRDHLKILRALIRDLDPMGREHDEGLKLHPLSLMREKWHGARFRVGRRAKVVSLTSSFDGHVAERCLEFAEVDRLVYHLAQNAVQHGAGDHLAGYISPVQEGAHLRWVFANRIDPEKRRNLLQLIASGVSLFDGGTAIDGKGWGLEVIAKSIDNAYGLAGNAFGEQVGYYGVRIEPERFLVWFHWPVAGE